ncbi:caspase family protein [uncultured Roseibium sp.]|uniref:caspase family protein n=1 Tax=uncultured Roseibium sp. TaxID=1936171 RepID=UPI0026334292|nr:caspase family protein [uncultured Roseibium sp.]
MTRSILPASAAFLKKRVPGFAPALVLAAGLAAPLPAFAGNLYGLVIGIDDYQHITDLKGAVNDARDVAGTLEKLEASKVILLTDAEATRDNVFASWRELTELAGPGDTLVFHYAGHGARQEAILPGHEELDNMFLLAGFDETGPGVNERIIDNEVGHLLAEEREATVVFVADSCFAGDMARAADFRAEVNVRVADVRVDKSSDRIADRVRQLGEVEEDALQNVIWLYAQDRNKVTQEVRIGEELRGALSYAFSRALEGEADGDSDRVLNTAELKRYVNSSVKRHTERRQRPEVNAGSRDLEILLHDAAGTPAPSAGLPELTLYAAPGETIPALSGIRKVDSKAEADLIYDGDGASLVYKTGDVIASFPAPPSAEALQATVDKWRFLAFLIEFAETEGPELDLSDGSRTYVEGEQVTFSIRSSGNENVVLFNLASNGAVQLVGPVRRGKRGLAAGKLRPGRTDSFRSAVIPPFGADHLIAITTPSPMPDLVDAVQDAQQNNDLAALAKEIGHTLDGQSFGLDWVGLYTRAKGDLQ